MKQPLQPKGILLGILLLLMAIASTALVYTVKSNQGESAAESEQP